jgi:hypothetical protein
LIYREWQLHSNDIVINLEQTQMDVSSIGSLSSALSQANTGDAVSTLVLKKAMDIQAQSAMQLLAALPAIPSTNNPPNLGNAIDITA